MTLVQRVLCCAVAATVWFSGGIAHAQLKVLTHSGSVAGLHANSHLIAGRDDGLLIDAQMTRADAAGVVALIHQSQVQRLTVFITHGHADHYLGLAAILAAFPDARVFSTAATATEIAKNGPGERDRWKRSLGDDIADRVIVPEVLRGRQFEVEGEMFRVFEMRDDSESVRPSVVYSRDLGWLFSGDLVYSGVHLGLVENRPKQWRTTLGTLEELGPITTVYPGHGEAGPPELIERNRTYLTRYMEFARKAESAEELIAAMQDLYPAHRLPFFLRQAANAAKGVTQD